MSSNEVVVGDLQDVRNGVRRLVFAGIAIILEVAWAVLLITRLNEYSTWIASGTRIIGVILVLSIIGMRRNASMKLLWIILILSAPIFGITLYFLLGLNGTTQRMRQRMEEVDAELTRFLPDNPELIDEVAETEPFVASMMRYISGYMHYPLYRNTDVRFYPSAKEGVIAQMRAMRQAKDFIFMEYHAIDDKRVYRAMERILLEKVAEGVEVRVLYDDIGSIGFISTDFIRRSEAQGIKCRDFNPVKPFVNLFLDNRDHRKIMVIDGKVGFTGGYNIADAYFNSTHPHGHWKDSGIRVVGDAVRSLTMMFLEMWNATQDTMDEDLERFFPKVRYSSVEDCHVQPYADTPIDGEQVGENVYLNIINSATRYLYIMTPYLIITDEMSTALSLAAKRGVDVRIITPGIPDKKIVYSVTRSYYNGLVCNGVRIFEYAPGFCHSKEFVVDDKVATCGTINLDYRSLYRHFENGCLLYDCQAVHDIKADFEATFPQCVEVTDQYLSVSRPVRLWQSVLRLFAVLL